MRCDDRRRAGRGRHERNPRTRSGGQPQLNRGRRGERLTLHLVLAYVAQRSKSDLLEPAISAYLDRIAPYVGIETTAFRSEDSLFTAYSRQRTRTPPWFVLLDSRGEPFSSESFAKWLGSRRDGGQQTIVLAIGPANGWSADARGQAQTLLSLGSMTLPHELARLVLAEQIYRAFTILAGHPYHTGH